MLVIESNGPKKTTWTTGVTFIFKDQEFQKFILHNTSGYHIYSCDDCWGWSEYFAPFTIGD